MSSLTGLRNNVFIANYTMRRGDILQFTPRHNCLRKYILPIYTHWMYIIEVSEISNPCDRTYIHEYFSVKDSHIQGAPCVTTEFKNVPEFSPKTLKYELIASIFNNIVVFCTLKYSII